MEEQKTTPSRLKVVCTANCQRPLEKVLIKDNEYLS